MATLPEIVVHTRLSRDEVVRRLRRVPAAAAGRGGARTEATAFLVRTALATQAKLYGAFVAKSQGQTDQAGLRWAPLRSVTPRLRKGAEGKRRPIILRDTGELRKSLAPGADPRLPPTSPPKVPSQVFRLGRGMVVIGTARKYAGTHHRGLPSRNLPQRRLWAPPFRWPSSWWQYILMEARAGVVDVVLAVLREG